MEEKILVGIVVGSDSDLPLIEETKKVLDNFGIKYEVNIISAHRTPEIAHQYAKTAHERGLEVIIAGAGGAAHLAGVIASLTPLPVIGIPIDSSSLNGLDALLSTVQMPPGIPVATVSIGKWGARNAAILAAEILGVKFPEMRQKVIEFKKQMAEEVQKKNLSLNK